MALPKLNTPTYELTLPSTGEKVRYRPFLVREHKVLLTMAEADNEEVSRIVKELVDVCTFNQLKIQQLPHFDIEYIFMNLRAKSISEIVEVTVTCECGEKIPASFSIDTLAVEKNPEHNSKIMIHDDLGVEMRYPHINEVVDIIVSKDNDKVIDLIINCIKGVFNNDNYWEAVDQTKEELSEFVLSLTKEQFDKIEQFFVTAPKIVQLIECDCPACKKHNTSRLEGLRNFFV